MDNKFQDGIIIKPYLLAPDQEYAFNVKSLSWPEDYSNSGYANDKYDNMPRYDNTPAYDNTNKYDNQNAGKMKHYAERDWADRTYGDKYTEHADYHDRHSVQQKVAEPLKMADIIQIREDEVDYGFISVKVGGTVFIANRKALDFINSSLQMEISNFKKQYPEISSTLGV